MGAMGTGSLAFYVLCLVVTHARCQMLQFGTCPKVETVKFFDIESFLGQWFVIEQYPTWFEDTGRCSYKTVEACGRRIEIEHGFVKNGVQFVLRWNSSYTPGDEAVFQIPDNRIDPLGVPIAVVDTNYADYALIYGCQVNSVLNFKYTGAWIMSRYKHLPEDTIHMLRMTLNSIPYTNPSFLERVRHDDSSCHHHWKAYVQAPEDNLK